jgi:hypothetical protein
MQLRDENAMIRNDAMATIDSFFREAGLAIDNDNRYEQPTKNAPIPVDTFKKTSISQHNNG